MAKYYIDAKMLRDRGACSMALEEFNRLFGSRMEVTQENMRKVFDSSWLYAGWVFARLTDAARHTRYYDEASRLANEFYDSGSQRDHRRTLRMMNRAGALWAKVKV